VSRPAARAILSSLVILSTAVPLAAQQADSVGVRLPVTATDSTVLHKPHALHAWEVGAVAAVGVLTIAVADQPIQDWSTDSAHRSQTASDVATVFRQFGQVDVVLPVTLGLIGYGLIAKKPGVLHSGFRVGASVLLAGVVTQGAKWVFGRARPDTSDSEWDFAPFSGNESMWSGHTAFAFAFATSLSQEIHRTWATVGLYGIATGTAWSRVYDNKHWASDVLMGAAAGIASAKLATGRWTLFGLRAPVPLATPDGKVMVTWSGTF
jgi:membrane-associated phospholipid phosphatase